MEGILTFLEIDLLGWWLDNHVLANGRIFDGLSESSPLSNCGPFDRKSMPKIPENSMLTKQMGPKTDESLAQISKLVYLNYFNCEIHSPHVDLFCISNVSFLGVFFFFLKVLFDPLLFSIR